MASRTMNPVDTLNHRVAMIFISFAPQGASAPLPNPIWAGSPALGQWGAGVASVSRSSAGVWLVTLTDSWYRLIGANSEVRNADGAASANTTDVGVQNINVTGATVNGNPAKTLNVTNSTITTAPALADISAATGAIVYVQLWVQNTSVQ